MEEFETNFRRLFNEWRKEWINEQNGPLPEHKFLDEFLPEQKKANRKEFEARDRLVDFTAKYIIENKDQITIVLKKIDSLFGGCFGGSCENDYIDFLHRVFAKTVNSTEVD